MKILITIPSFRSTNMVIIYFNNFVILIMSFIFANYYLILPNNTIKIYKIYNPSYLTYDCYIVVKKDLEKIIELSDWGNQNFEEAIKNMHYDSHYMESINSVLKKLGTFFTADNAFGYIGQEPSCIYVNHWLNNKLKVLYDNKPNYDITIFKDFADKFSRARNGIKNSCKPYMRYYNEEEWDKIKILYKWYDKFENFISSNKYKTDSKCDEIASLRRDFREFTYKHDGKDKELIEKLMKFKDLLRTKLLGIHENCKNEIDYFKYPPQYLQKKEQEQAAAAAREAAAREEQAEKERAKQRAEDQQRAQPQSHQGALSINPLNGEQTQTLTDVPGNNLILETQRSPHERLQSRRHGDSEGQVFRGLIPFTSEQLRDDQERWKYPEVENTGLENKNVDQPLTSGVFGTLKNTLSGITDYVEPVPLIGVSGGMGALFLLLRVFKILNL
ncbi:hypothetical protein PVMG_06053 [Plasmodium vivax Mauritania I]|uniref:Uncharacterized protein n=1 Tax=Plasmodium vivax Mauritania I TaxID=1035515 RepID=A0A0J9TJK4_PLAVI|nr:hypothetical protein PVMG_06053 [Plasmodium vivax Mauritania I]